MSMELGNPFVLIDVLLRHNVSFVIIGGYAVIYHGVIRATEDIDILFERTALNETRLLSALLEVEAYWIGNELDPSTGIEQTSSITAEYIACTHLMMLGTRFGYLDVFDFVPGLPDASVHSLIADAEYCQGRPFVQLTWLKQMKSASNRPQDREDLRRLP